MKKRLSKKRRRVTREAGSAAKRPAPLNDGQCRSGCSHITSQHGTAQHSCRLAIAGDMDACELFVVGVCACGTPARLAHLVASLVSSW